MNWWWSIVYLSCISITVLLMRIFDNYLNHSIHVRAQNLAGKHHLQRYSRAWCSQRGRQFPRPFLRKLCQRIRFLCAFHQQGRWECRQPVCQCRGQPHSRWVHDHPSGQTQKSHELSCLQGLTRRGTTPWLNSSFRFCEKPRCRSLRLLR